MENSQRRQLGRSVVWNTLGNLVYYASQYVLLILAKRLAGDLINGEVSVAMAIAAICLSFSNYGMRSFQISDFARQYTDRTYLRSRYFTVAAAGVGCAVFAFAVSYTAQQRGVILLYTLSRLSEGYIDVWHGYLQRADRMDLVGILFGIRGLMTMAVFGLGFWLTQDILFTMALLALFSWICVFAADVPPSRRRADLSAAGGGSVRSLLWQCAPLAVYSFLNSSIGSVVKLVCERIVGTEQFSCFNNVFAPVQILQVGAMYIFAPFMLTFARAWEAHDRRGYGRALGLCAAAMPVLWAAGAAGAALLGPWALTILYGADIRAYSYLLQPAVAAAVANIFVAILCLLLSMMREMKGLIFGNVAGIAAAFWLSAPMVTRMGLAGAAWATVASRGIQAACCLAVVLWRYYGHFAAKPANGPAEK